MSREERRREMSREEERGEERRGEERRKEGETEQTERILSAPEGLRCRELMKGLSSDSGGITGPGNF